MSQTPSSTGHPLSDPGENPHDDPQTQIAPEPEEPLDPAGEEGDRDDPAQRG